MTLYHSDIYIPEWVMSQLPKGSHELKYTRHAKVAGYFDEFGIVINRPQILDCSTARLIEVETIQDRAYKAVYRMSYTPYQDICVVVVLDIFLVLTVWINDKADTHPTLNKTRYAPKPQIDLNHVDGN